MDLKTLFFRKKAALNSDMALSAKPAKATDNPYLKGAEGRQEWNDRYGTMADSVRKWQWACLFAGVLLVIFAGVIAKQRL